MFDDLAEAIITSGMMASNVYCIRIPERTISYV